MALSPEAKAARRAADVAEAKARYAAREAEMAASHAAAPPFNPADYPSEAECAAWLAGMADIDEAPRFHKGVIL